MLMPFLDVMVFRSVNINNKEKMKAKVVGVFVSLGDGYVRVKQKGKVVKLKSNEKNWD